MKGSGAAVVVRALEEEGVRFTFGIPGTHNIELYDALDRSDTVRPILVTDEQAASFMADGVARSSGRVGVLNLVPGAGVTHALSGIAEAFMDNVPLVVLTCGIRNDTGRAYQLHDIDQAGVLRPVTKAVLRPESAADVYPAVRRAFALARSGCPGPVAVEIAANYYLMRHDLGAVEAPAPPPPPPAPDPDLLGQAAELLAGSRNPALYVGFGARGAVDEIRAVAERLGAPVCTTIQGKGVFPEDHPLFLWNGFGASAPRFVRTVMDRCDVLLAVGCRFGEVATASYGLEPPEALIHVDIDPDVFDRNAPARVAIEADAAVFARALFDLLPPERRQGPEEEIAAGRREVVDEWARHRSEDRVTPAMLFAAAQELADADAIFTTDSGNGTFLAMEHLRLDAPGRFLAPVDYSCMGYAVPAAIGAKLAWPDRDVIAFAGDGALLMTGLELVTAAAYRAAPVVCVLRDGELAQIAQFQRTTLDRDTCSILHPFSVEAFAEAANCAYLSLRTDDKVTEVLRRSLEIAREGRPVVVEVAIDYSRKTYFTRGVVATNFWRLPWRERMRLLGRAVGRRVVPTA